MIFIKYLFLFLPFSPGIRMEKGSLKHKRDRQNNVIQTLYESKDGNESSAFNTCKYWNQAQESSKNS